MAKVKIAQDRRCRGRPQVRPDEETRQIIYETARHEFAASGYAATGMETVARRAGVSTKTLYRLIPTKAALFEGMVSDRLDRFVSEVNLRVADHTDIEEALCAALMACAELTLDEEVIALQRIVLQEAGKKRGDILAYHVLSVDSPRDHESDVILLIEYKNMAVFDRAFSELDKDTTAAFGSTLGSNKAAVKREDIRVLHGGVSARELVFPK